MTSGSVTVSNVSAINGSDTSDVYPVNIESNGGSFQLTLNGSSNSFILCNLFLTVQNQGDFTMEVLNSTKESSFTLKGNSIISEGGLQFTCQDILWNVETIAENNSYRVIVVMNDPDCGTC